MSFNRVRPSEAADPTSTPIARPAIWAEGRQRPKFGIGPYLAVSLAMAKRDLVPEMADAAGRLTRLGRRIVEGDLKLNLPATGSRLRLVPSHQRVGAAVLGLARLFDDARLVLDPAPVPDEPIAYPNLIRPNRPVRLETVAAAPIMADPPQAKPKPIEPTLQAIRSAIGSTAHDFAAEGSDSHASPTAVADQTPTPNMRWGLRAGLWRATGWGLIGVLMLFAIPAGLVRAMAFHLNGGDLNDWS